MTYTQTQRKILANKKYELKDRYQVHEAEYNTANTTKVEFNVRDNKATQTNRKAPLKKLALMQKAQKNYKKQMAFLKEDAHQQTTFKDFLNKTQVFVKKKPQKYAVKISVE